MSKGLSGIHKRLDNFSGKPCIYCAENTSGPTGDHVPPQSWIEGKVREDYPCVRVPCCDVCNASFKNDDDGFRIELASLEDVEMAGMESLILEKSLQVVGRWSARTLRRELLTSLRTVNLVTPAGLHAGQKMAIVINEQRLQRVFGRFVKALHWTCRGGGRLSKETQIKTTMSQHLEPEVKSEIINKHDRIMRRVRLYNLCDHRFKFKFAVTGENPYRMFWIFLLWGAAEYWSFVEGPNPEWNFAE